MTQSDIGIVEKLKRISEGGNYPIALKPNLPANPDGPEAAAIIMEMVKALEEARSYIVPGRNGNEVREHIDATLARVSGK